MDNLNSGSQELNGKISEWMQWDKNEATLEEIRKLVNDSEWEKLKLLLLTRLSFGTAGLRGAMRAGFNGMNELVVLQTAQGLLKYVQKCYPNVEDQKRGVVFGYDGRYQSKRFAEISASIFLHADIPVYLYGKTVATPMVPFAVLEKKCLAGVMVTASHNPKNDNGYKVYWTNSAQIISPHDKGIQESILQNLIPWPTSWNVDKLDSPLLSDPYDEMVQLYFEKLSRVIPKSLVNDCNAKSKVQFVYTAMHGVGWPFVEQGFATAGLKPPLAVKEQRDPDPEFPTVQFPNPEEGKSSLVLSIKLANETNCNVILANDPDADRLACAEKNPQTGEWKVFTGNELGALLGWWSIFCYRRDHPKANLNDCYLLASTVSSKMLAAVAKIEGLHFIETLTGFKWMGNKSVELIEKGKTVLFAFEEAIGFMFSPTVLDKDGVSAACYLATMTCYIRQEENKSLTEKLEDLYRTYGFHYTITSYFLCYDPEVIVKIFERIRNFTGENTYPTAVVDGKYEVKHVRDLTTGFDTSQSDGKAIFPVSRSSQMITFTFKNGTVVTLRTSGTEPKIKYYAEMCAEPNQSDWSGLKKTLSEMVEGIVLELLQPAKYNLIPKPE
ncbi:phosphopentomutase [Phlebotomus papatasi]|uniref:phosphopentomutase n=1 Tax=Phlebotomus papatasi TaxID=29031 RepID=UPI0024841739|nr:phosphopentomutase [Phlebotomus papatasi]XP_055712011.1 phosphopentomutase [Phlebotomus papatasi]XP_055712012.1 phosphopentomutase [Phlebotomus papatasi]XP_055712013.1 phosphopentomutase [Phlebotomus papatasi]